jgi:hypothetical protein
MITLWNAKCQVDIHQAAQCHSNRKTFYKQASANWEELETTEAVCCVLEVQEEEGHCVLVRRV